MPTLSKTSKGSYPRWSGPLVTNQLPWTNRTTELDTLPSILEEDLTLCKRKKAIAIGFILCVLLGLAIGVPFIVETINLTTTSTTSSTGTTSTTSTTSSSSSTSSTSSTSTTSILCLNGGTPLWNGTCACNNYTTGTHCETPLCLVAGSLSATCSNNGTCSYNSLTNTGSCSCPSSSWTALCPNCNNNCGYGYCNSPSSCYCNSGYQGTCCNTTITSGKCLSLEPANTTSWGNGFNNTFYGNEHDVANVSCASGKTLKVAACFYGINSANPGCQPPTASATCSSMDVTSKCASQCNSNSCNFAVENTVFGDTCYGLVKTFWMYYTCS
ncbi:unnamed protein product [Adineta ricciae]|uniref:SUEL-type lectin domain-containing protein n=1 Tax=Adineta ricciae TaxID=249248 RepID=A0A816A206_ADIRI|nr:unnamed protein product [Adineta ricciae]